MFFKKEQNVRKKERMKERSIYGRWCMAVVTGVGTRNFPLPKWTKTWTKTWTKALAKISSIDWVRFVVLCVRTVPFREQTTKAELPHQQQWQQQLGFSDKISLFIN